MFHPTFSALHVHYNLQLRFSDAICILSRVSSPHWDWVSIKLLFASMRDFIHEIKINRVQHKVELEFLCVPGANRAEHPNRRTAACFNLKFELQQNCMHSKIRNSSSKGNESGESDSVCICVSWVLRFASFNFNACGDVEEMGKVEHTAWHDWRK